MFMNPSYVSVGVFVSVCVCVCVCVCLCVCVCVLFAIIYRAVCPGDVITVVADVVVALNYISGMT